MLPRDPVANFVSFAFSVLGPPARFASGLGKLLWGGVAAVHDAWADGAMYAQASSLIAVAPEDALPLIGYERQIVQGPAETNTSYRARLQAAWSAWEQAGTVAGLQAQLTAFFGGAVQISESKDYSYLPNWSTFWVIVPSSLHSYTSISWGLEQTLRGIVRRWKDASTVCETISLIVSGRLWGYPIDGYTYADAATDGLLYGDSVSLEISG